MTRETQVIGRHSLYVHYQLEHIAVNDKWWDSFWQWKELEKRD